MRYYFGDRYAFDNSLLQHVFCNIFNVKIEFEDNLCMKVIGRSVNLGRVKRSKTLY